MTPGRKEDSMSHVDEGTLHAYLDGELPAPERTALEAHLAGCATCRAALSEERALLERATALLGAARPVERPAPPFEQLRQAPNRSPWRVRTSFAWAASLALALGLGYYLRSPDRTVATASTPEPQPMSAPFDRSVAIAPAPPTVVRQRAREHPAAQAADEVAQARPSARRDSSPGVTGGSLKSAGRPTANALAVRQPEAALEEVVVTGAPAPSAAKTRASLATRWPAIDRQTAAAILGIAPVGLPGLPIRSMRLGAGPDRTVLVEQALDSTTVIQLFERLAGVTAPSESLSRADARADEWVRQRANRLARFVGRLRVEIAGPVSPDSLNRLLEQVVPLP
jgi:hypothetical protein